MTGALWPSHKNQIFSLIRLWKALFSHPSQSNNRILQPIIFIGNCSVKILAVFTFCDISNNDSTSTMRKSIPDCTLTKVKLQKNI